MEQIAAVLEALASLNVEPVLGKGGSDPARPRALAAARQLSQRLETPLELSRRLGWEEPSHLMGIKLALDIGILEALHDKDSSKGLTAAEVAQGSVADEELTGRLLRHLAAWNTISEITIDRYRSTRMSRALLDPKVSSGIVSALLCSRPRIVS